MSEYIDSQGLDDDVRLAIIGQIQLLLHEHQEKVALKHHLKKELETLHDPPEKRHSLQKYRYDEMMREARERDSAEAHISEEETHTKEPEVIYLQMSIPTPKTQEKGKKKRTAAQRRLEQIMEDIKKIDDGILKRRERDEEADKMLERNIDKRQRAIIDLDVQFLLQIMDEPSLEKLGETRDGLSQRTREIEQDIRVLRKCLFDTNSADEDTGTRSRAEMP